MHVFVVSQDLIQREVGNKTEQEGWGIARRDQIFKCQGTRQPPFKKQSPLAALAEHSSSAVINLQGWWVQMFLINLITMALI
jgi:hypothetical protein